MTGYLTQRARREDTRFELVIPNKEIHSIFATQIMDLFRENVKKDGEGVKRFCEALKNGDEKGIESQFGAYLRKTISLRDTFVRKERKENFHGVEAITKGSKKQNPSACFYHGILLGILGTKESWAVSSNGEAGDGYSDIQIEIVGEELGIIIEVKYADSGNLDAACQEALDQIEKMHYDDDLKDDGIDHILKYGIACYKKRCKVMLADS